MATRLKTVTGRRIRSKENFRGRRRVLVVLERKEVKLEFVIMELEALELLEDGSSTSETGLPSSSRDSGSNGNRLESGFDIAVFNIDFLST